MRIFNYQDEINERKNIWQEICWRMNEKRFTPQKLASLTGYPLQLIERGVTGEPVPIEHALHKFVEAFGLTSGRMKFYEETDDLLSYEECRKLIKPPPAMPPRQGNFWDRL